MPAARSSSRAPSSTSAAPYLALERDSASGSLDGKATAAAIRTELAARVAVLRERGVVPGLGLLPGVVLDQHFAERHRYPRLLHAVLAHPTCLGLGLSEETGLLLRPGQPAEVFGDEVVFAFDAATAQYISLVGPGPRQPVSGHGLTTHLLVAGQRFDLATRQAAG